MTVFLRVLVFVLVSFQAQAAQWRVILDREQPDRYSPVVGPALGLSQMTAGSVVFTESETWAMPSMPYRDGMIANRPADPAYTQLKSLSERFDYFQSHDLRSLLAMPNSAARQAKIAALSPAEKYDLVIGDPDRTFSTAVWEEVHKQFARGEVPSWLGLCDGSSSASIRFEAPRKSVRVPSRLAGVSVDFTVGDLKSLLAFSMTTYVSTDLPIFGQRCNSSSGCVSLNPASLHEILQQMALDPERFPHMIVDRIASGAIWNSALLSASFGYYNPWGAALRSDRALDALVDVQEYAAPAGSPGWASGTQYLLFVSTTLRMADTRTSTGYNELKSMQALDQTVQYVLEVNRQFQIIGGEWLSDKHPGFIWALPKDYRPTSVGDRRLSGVAWEGTAIPDSALPSVLESSRVMQPLFRIVDWIYQQSL